MKIPLACGLALLIMMAALPAQADAQCREMRITGYVRTDFSAATYDGTSIYTSEPIVAASWDIPIGHYVLIQGKGLYRVADRGSGLGSSGWIDIPAWTRGEALDLTGRRTVCVYAPWELPKALPEDPEV